jgi:S1-C subfamily serine protease
MIPALLLATAISAGFPLPPEPPPDPLGKGYIGIYLHEENGQTSIRDFTPISPARAAGLKPGDIILRVDGENVVNLIDASTLIRRTRPGNDVTFDLLRGEEKLTIRVKAGIRPDNLPP